MPKALAIDSMVTTENAHDTHGVMKKITITCAESARWSPDINSFNDSLVFVFHCSQEDSSPNRAHNQALADLERMCESIAAIAKRTARLDHNDVEPVIAGPDGPDHPELLV